MKELMLGNQAVARGIYEAGCSLVSSYPGTPSTEITEFASKYDDVYCEWAPNEKVAMETAFGASLAGYRSACCMKHVGLNVAADPLFTLSYTGVNGGLLVCVADDPAAHSSQNEQDSRHYAIAAKLPMLEPADSAEAKDFAKLGFDLSEQFDTPMMLRMCTRIAHSQCSVELCDPKEKTHIEYVKNASKYVMNPHHAVERHPIVEARMAKLADYAETSDINRIEMAQNKSLGIITSGTVYYYVKEVFGDSVSVLKLGMINPLPEKKIRDFASKFDRVVVIEELDPIIENFCKQIGLKVEGKNLFSILYEFNQNTIRRAFGIEVPFHYENPEIPVRPPIMCAGCPHRGVFYLLKKLGINVIGDIGCYTLGVAQPLEAVDSVICMGASVSGLHGFNKVAERNDKTVCVIGDSTFMHSGMTGLANIAYNDSKSTVLILDNSTTGMTGHQNNPTNGKTIKGDPATQIDLESLCKSLGINRVTVVDPFNLSEVERVLKEELAVDEASVIIARKPCALLKTFVHGMPYIVDTASCKGCKVCMKVGCPAIRMYAGKAVIDKLQCTGCGVCAQVCAFHVIEKGE